MREQQKEPVTGALAAKPAQKPAQGDAQSTEPSRPGRLLDSSAVNRQLREIEKVLAKTSGEGGAGDAAKYQLKQLRKALLDEQLAQFDSQREPIQQDMREAVLGRLTAPSQRLFDQLSFDPQVLTALDVAKNEQRYNALLQPTDAVADVPPEVSPLVKMPGSAQS